MDIFTSKQTLREKLKKSHLVGQHCQRNFDLSKKIPEADVEIIIHAATQCPSKQNMDFYSVIAIEDRTLIENIYKNTQTAKGRKNPQVLGQLLLLFVSNTNVVSKNDRNGEVRHWDISTLRDDMNQAVGVAAGFVNVTSSMLGYRTGCNKCFDSNVVSALLDLKDGQEVLLMMGIGIKDDNRNRREEHYTGKTIDTFTKIPINVTRI